jgi:hypothetical protein
MRCEACGSINVVQGKCLNCGSIVETRFSVAEAKDAIPNSGEWSTSWFTVSDAFSSFLTFFALAWILAFSFSDSPWGLKVVIDIVVAMVAAMCLSAILSPARKISILADGSVTFERRRFRPRTLTVHAGEIQSVTASLLDMNRFRPMTVKATTGSITYLPPRDHATEIFQMIARANPKAWITRPLPFWSSDRN